MFTFHVMNLNKCNDEFALDGMETLDGENDVLYELYNLAQDTLSILSINTSSFSPELNLYHHQHQDHHSNYNNLLHSSNTSFSLSITIFQNVFQDYHSCPLRYNCNRSTTRYRVWRSRNRGKTRLAVGQNLQQRGTG